jgi:A/G-specific adenine glycosylase
MSDEQLADVLRQWYADHARDLPWRTAHATPWGVLVSEVMLQQTPVARVLPVWHDWLRRWPAPADLARSSAGEAVRAWGRLGYPRRALRLHASAVAIVGRHGGRVPSAYDDLRALPGVGDYTASAVMAFAFHARAAVLDTNVRRVYARLFDGTADKAGSVTVGERAAAIARLPSADPASYSVAVMELGALVCTARAPGCDRCPVAGRCRWSAAGRPMTGRRRAIQAYAGTDRQARGCLLAVLRSSDTVPPAALDEAWPDPVQRQRALQSLVDDGLAVRQPDESYRLPA